MGSEWRQLGLGDGVDESVDGDVGSPQPVMTSELPSSPFKPALEPASADRALQSLAIDANESKDAGEAEGVGRDADVTAGPLQSRATVANESKDAGVDARGRHITLLQAARDAGVVRRKRRGNFNRNPTGRGGFADHPENRSKGGKKRIPTSQKELKALIAALADESIPTDEGEVQRLVAMLRNMMQSKSPVDHMEILNRLVGRQASKVDMTSGGAKIGWSAFIQMTVAPSLPSGGGEDADEAVDADVMDADVDADASADALLEDEARR